MTIRVRVGEACEGHGNCFAACPEVFDLNDEGYARGLDRLVPEDLEPKVRLAVSRCPENAIVLEPQSESVGGS